MPRLHILSDIHDDYSRIHFGNWQIPDDVDADIVVVAGDIAGRLSTMGRDWIEAQAHRLGKPIVIVAGNHDFWRGSIDREIDRFRDRLQHSGVHLLHGDSIVLQGVRFVGGTLWTDYELGGNANVAAQVATATLNDFHYLRTGTGRDRPRARPRDLAEVHAQHREFIETKLEKFYDGPTVVVTHHAPSPRSLRHGRYVEPSDASYASDLEDAITYGQPDLWIHGHVHTRHDYQIGETRVVCNPRGYVGWQKRWGVGQLDLEHDRFDERLVIEVKRKPNLIPEGFEVENGQLTYGGVPLGPVRAVLQEMRRYEHSERYRARYGSVHPTTMEPISDEEHRAIEDERIRSGLASLERRRTMRS